MNIGNIAPFIASTPPTNYLECDGASLNTTTYSSLFSVIGYSYGGSDSNFNIPDLRGKFVRGWAHGSTADPDRASRTDRGDGTTGDNVGTQQADEIDSHNHSAAVSNFIVNNYTGVNYSPEYRAGGGYDYPTSLNTQNSGGNETRPVNANVMYCIKFA